MAKIIGQGYQHDVGRAILYLKFCFIKSLKEASKGLIMFLFNTGEKCYASPCILICRELLSECLSWLAEFLDWDCEKIAILNACPYHESHGKGIVWDFIVAPCRSMIVWQLVIWSKGSVEPSYFLFRLKSLNLNSFQVWSYRKTHSKKKKKLVIMEEFSFHR